MTTNEIEKAKVIRVLTALGAPVDLAESAWNIAFTCGVLEGNRQAAKIVTDSFRASREVFKPETKQA